MLAARISITSTPTATLLGVQKASEREQARHYWKGWRQDVEDHCRCCKKCGKRNAPGKLPRARLGTCPSGYPMERVAMAVVGPLPKTNCGNRFSLVINVYFTKWPAAYAITNHVAETIARRLVEEWISRYGVMQHLNTDQGREFESKIFQTMCKMLGVNKTRTTTYHPQSHGLVERCNRTLKDMLSILINSSQNDWDVWIPRVLFAYRKAVHASTGVTPYCMLYGREARMPVDLLVKGVTASDEVLTDVPTYLQKMKGMFERAYDMARTKLEKSTLRYKDYYDSKAKKEGWEG